MNHLYETPKNAIRLFLIILILASVLAAFLATEYGHKFRLGLEIFLYPVYFLAWSFPVLLGLAGIIHAIVRRSFIVFVVWSFSVTVTLLAVYLFYSFVTDCGVSLEVLAEMKKQISAKEMEKSMPSRWICPTKYYYFHDGKKMVASGIPDIIHGPKVYFIDINDFD